MARETLAQREIRHAEERLIEETRRQAFKDSLPKRLMYAQALAVSLGLDVSLTLTESGPAVRFVYKSTHMNIDCCLTYDSLEWNVVDLEESLQALREKFNSDARRADLARTTFDTLTKEQKAAVKEFIHLL